jgi:hypothetical protein
MAFQARPYSASPAQALTPPAITLGNALRAEFGDLAQRFAVAKTAHEQRAVIREGAQRLAKSKTAAAALKPMQKRDYKSIANAGMPMFMGLHVKPALDIFSQSAELSEEIAAASETGAGVVEAGAVEAEVVGLAAPEVVAAEGGLVAAFSALCAASPLVAVGVVVFVVIVAVCAVNHLSGHKLW